MTERKWTPGPWVVEYENDAGCDGGFWEWFSAGPAKVEYSDRHEGGEETAKANAHLIAAAPELYEALEVMTVAYEFEYGQDCPQAKFARAALAKARGEK